ncbi:MAG TPA: PAS domain-containing sensor histidine kinase [Burkholderiales bacterium]|jgi:PAS domain S-box-containing protein|nr:PAS domain-containing sensor histidine kinase [Burkholderiales bacterium]
MNSPSTAAERTSASSRISLRQSADPRYVLADRVEQLYSQMPTAIIATLVISAVAAYELRAGRYAEVVVFWAVLVLFLTIVRTALYWGYRRAREKVKEAEQWMRWLGISALAAGATWGFAGAVFFPSHADEQQVFLAFLLTIVVTGGIPIYAVSWIIYALYAAGILFPFTYVLATFGNKLFAEIALIVPAFYALNVGIAYRLNRVFDSGYRLRHAYGKLTEDYTALNQRLEQQLIELEEARRQVEASGRKLALFAERSPIAVLELDVESRIQQVNPAAENLFGYPPAELIGKPASHLILPKYQDDFARQWRELLQTRAPMSGLRLRNPRRDGIEIVCEWTVTPLVNAANDIVSLIAQGRDITQQLEAERIKKEFTSTLSHELRTPLTSIIGSLQLINSGVLGDIDKDVLELTTIAERNGQRLLDLINDILDVEKIESGKLTLFVETVDLTELVAESITLNRAFADRFKVGLAAVGERQPVRVNADRKRLLQVMTNLISNAAKFSPEGSTVEISMESCDHGIHVGVHDRGPGIPDNFRSRIFGRFAQADMSHTRQKGGTGLGLAICKRLLEMMGGKIGFSDRDGGGTTFWFELPKQA